MKKNNLLILFTFLFTFSCLFGQDLNLSLKDAVELALINNPKIKQYEEKLRQKENDNLSAWGNFLPSVNFDLSYTHLNDDMSIDLDPIKQVIVQLNAGTQTQLQNISSILSGKAPFSDQQKLMIQNQIAAQLNNQIPPFTETFKQQNYKTATISGIQPLFLGGKLISAKNYAASEKSSAQYELEKIRDEISAEVMDAYTKVALLKQVVITRKNVLNGMEKHREDAKRIFDQGLIANYHLLRAEVAVAEAERNLINDKNNLTLAIYNLNTVIGIDQYSSTEITDTLKFNPFDNSSAWYQKTAEENQPILKMIKMKMEEANSNKWIARSSFLPQVFAFGKYEMYPEYLSSLEPRWAVGLQMRFNLFNGFKDYLKLQNASHLEDEVKFIELEAKRKINLWVNKSFLDAENSKTRFQKLIATEELANENLRQNEKRFLSGLGTSIEVIDARLSLEKVEIDKLISLYEYYHSLSNLFLATGTTEEFFKVWKN
jgi:outer membrane protein TolC